VNREQWLTEAAKLMEPIFREKGFPIRDKYRLTCGWPCKSAMSFTGRRIGECHPPSVSAGGVNEIFISPTIAENTKVLGTVCHELIHVAVGVEAGHAGKFKTACRYLGMVGKATEATTGDNLRERIAGLVEGLGTYPHQAIKVAARTIKKPATYIVLECGCGCSVRITADNLESAGLPTCGCGEEFTLKQKGE
jgi:hypothetical protein